MRIETLREFTVYARELNVSRAARKLNIAQSTLSRHLIDMERELGFKIIDRDTGNGLTAAGMSFLSCAEQILLLYETNVRACKDLARVSERTIIVQEYGGHPDVSAHLSSLVGQFNGIESDCTIEWKRFSGYDLAEALLEGELDVGQTVIHESVWEQTSDELSELGIDALVLHEEGIVYWMKADLEAAQLGEATLEKLCDFAIAMPLGKVYNPMRDAMSDLFESRGLMPLFSYGKTWSVSDMALAEGYKVACALPPDAKEDPSLKLRDDMAFVDITDVRDGFLTCLLFRQDEEKEQVRAFRKFVEANIG